MDIHEYQAKELLAGFGVPVPRGGLAYSPEQAAYRAREVGGEQWVVKAQVHTGARGKAGGILLCRDEHEIWDAADQLLGRRLVTHQTGPEGKEVGRIYVEEGCDIARELYLGAVLDRATGGITFMASTEGGVEIEEVAAATPERILKEHVDPAVGLQAFQCRNLAFKLGLDAGQVREFTTLMLALYAAFVATSAG